MALRDRVEQFRERLFEEASEDEFIEYLAEPFSDAIDQFLKSSN